VTLTTEGFTGKRLPQIKAELEQALQNEFGVDLNLAPETVIGQIVGLESEARAITWADLEDVYQSQYPSTASGVALDRVVNLNGITRLPALPTTVTAIVGLALGTTLTAGRKARDGAETYSLTDQVVANASQAEGGVVSVTTVTDGGTYTVTIDGTDMSITAQTPATKQNILTDLASALSQDTEIGDGDLSIRYDGPLPIAVSSNLALDSVFMAAPFQADTTGPKALPVNALSGIETPVAGWLSVTNDVAGTTGRNVETDADLRVRREQSVRIRATNTLEGIAANLLATEDVLDAVVLENTGTTVDGNGIPPQHIWAIVEGGEAAEIGRVIYDRKAAGIGTFGTNSVDVQSQVTGQLYSIRYERPTITPIFVRVTIEDSPSLPSDYVARVRAALVAYADTLKIGEDMIRNRLFGPIYGAIDGQSFVTDVLIDTSSPPAGMANIPAGTAERMSITAEDVDVLLA